MMIIMLVLLYNDSGLIYSSVLKTPSPFKTPVCDIFKPRIYLDQLCYETNLQDLKDSKKIGKQLEKGLTLVLDYNEERQSYNIMKQNESQMVTALYPDNNDASIFLDTISLLTFKKGFVKVTFKF